jgi:hypothetical protein
MFRLKVVGRILFSPLDSFLTPALSLRGAQI